MFVSQSVLWHFVATGEIGQQTGWKTWKFISEQDRVYIHLQGAGNVYIDLIRNDLHSYMLAVFGYGKIQGYIELIFLHKFINEYLTDFQSLARNFPSYILDKKKPGSDFSVRASAYAAILSHIGDIKIVLSFQTLRSLVPILAPNQLPCMPLLSHPKTIWWQRRPLCECLPS